jgi:DnaJ-class molecular chaperone
LNDYQAYQTLNLDSNASFDDVKYAYRKLALELHPDKNSKEQDGNKFKSVTSAYHVLKNSHKKMNSKDVKSSKKDFTNTKTEQNFRKKKPQWGANPNTGTPEEDWSRFTKDFEDANPNFWKKYEKEFWENYDARVNNDRGYGSQQERKKKSEPEINFSVDVDPSLCIGCCSCETIAPDVFIVDKLTKMNPKSRVHNQRGAGFNKVMNAAETCPTHAINVNDKDNKKRIYPW